MNVSRVDALFFTFPLQTDRLWQFEFTFRLSLKLIQRKVNIDLS